jgi:hypothetical protein
MEAIRTTQRVKNHQISVHVPDIYENAEVEVIVVLMDSKNQTSGNKKETFLQDKVIEIKDLFIGATAIDH